MAGSGEKLASEHGALLAVVPEAEVLVCEVSSDATLSATKDVALLDEERLVDVFEGVGLFTKRRSESLQADWTASEALNNRGDDAAVHLVEACAIDIKLVEGMADDRLVDRAVSLDVREVPHAAEQTVGRPRGTLAAPRKLDGCVVVDGRAENR